VTYLFSCLIVPQRRKLNFPGRTYMESLTNKMNRGNLEGETRLLAG